DERPLILRPDMDLLPTPSQTAGPFFHLGLPANFSGTLAGPDAQGERVHLICRILDGDGRPVPDALIELWQANAEGRYQHPDEPRNKDLRNEELRNGDLRNDDLQNKVPGDPAFCGFGRMATSEDGSCIFETIKPGRVPGRESSLQSPHLNVSVFARGILKRLATRIYFSGDP